MKTICKPHNKAGFTLIELMVVVVIVGILATIAYPSFMDAVRKSRRQDAITALQGIQLAQEKWRATHTSYATLTELGLSATSAQGYYTLAVTLPAPPDDQVQYTATATAKAGSSQVLDKADGVSCATLTVNQDQSLFTPASQKACWGR